MATTNYYRQYGYAGDGFYPNSGPLPFADTITGLDATYVATELIVRVSGLAPITEADIQAGLGWWISSGSGSEVREITSIYRAGDDVIIGIPLPFSGAFGPTPLEIVQPCFQSISLLNDGAVDVLIDGTPLAPGISYTVIRENFISHSYVNPVFYDKNGGSLKISVQH